MRKEDGAARAAEVTVASWRYRVLTVLQSRLLAFVLAVRQDAATITAT